MAAPHATTVLELASGRELAFAEYGDPQGAPVFGFHGTPGSNRQLAPWHEAGVAERVRVIAPDRPGYGHSRFDPYRRLVDWPRDVGELAAHLGLARFGVFGVSGGGPHAAVCAHAFGAKLTGASIVSGVAPPDTRGWTEGMMGPNQLNFALARRSELLVWPMAALMLFGMKHFPDRALDGLLRSLPESDRRILTRKEVADVLIGEARDAAPTTARAVAQDFALFARPWGFKLEDVAAPVHVWHGDADRNVPAAHGRAFADRIPNAKLHLYPNEGHMLFFEHTGEILRAAAGRAGAG
ncbi:MAG TPA: alpha/beta hydrolase [Myxococcota bacterium]|nr:alpha/beta hydrolase [Myxococcota bacterium]